MSQIPVENPISLIESTIDNFQIEPDITLLERIDENLSSLKSKRLDNIEESKEILKKLTRKYQEIQHQVEQSEKSESRLLVQRQIQDLESKEFEMAKNLTDLEFSINQLNSNLSNLMNVFNNLNQENDNIIEQDMIENYDSILLKLKLFKKMGIVIDFQDEKTNDKIVIYNQSKDTTNVLSVDDQYSGYFISNYIWERI